MLSRLAESFFWMGRYLERCEATSRLLLEHHQLTVQQHSVNERDAVTFLTDLLVLSPSSLNVEELIAQVYGEESNASTILGSLSATRNNARTIRDAIPGDLYEALNSAYVAGLAENPNPRLPGTVLRSQIQRLAVINGVLEWIAPRDQSFDFLQLGRSLERLDLTARLVAAGYENIWPDQGPATMLRSVDALSTFVRGQIPLTGKRVKGFLIGDRIFPRSIYFCAQTAETSLRRLKERDDTLYREIALLRSELEFSDPNASESAQLRIAARATSVAANTSARISSEFFRPAGSIIWSN